MSDTWNEMLSQPQVSEDWDETWPYRFKWAFNAQTGEGDVWRTQGGTDGRPTHRQEVRERWGRDPKVAEGDVMGLAAYIPAETKLDGTIVAPPEIQTQTYYNKPTPPQIVQWFQKEFPHATVRDAVLARPRLTSKVASPRRATETLKWIWNKKHGLLVWEADDDNLPTHTQKTMAAWGRAASPYSEGDILGYAYPDPEKVEVESYDTMPIPAAAFAAIKQQLAEWYPNHQIVGDNQEKRTFGSDPADYHTAALEWAWENLPKTQTEPSPCPSKTTVRKSGLLARLFRRKTADADMDGCMVALFVPEETAKKLRPRGGEDTQNMHITLLYFKDKAADRDDWDEVKKLVEQIANQHPVLSGKISGYGVFNTPDGDVLWASPSVQGLAELRHKLYEACTDAGFTINDEHDWVPHLTLKYNHRGKLPESDDEISLYFTDLSFAQGEKKRHYEFKGHLEKRAMATPEIIGSIFRGPGQDGDFAWMARQPEHARTLFIFNDNQDQFEQHVAGDHSACFAGQGNATIRPLQDQSPPRAAGVPTGSLMRRGAGYDALTPEVKEVIDQALANIRALAASGNYDRIIYSDDGQGGLGTGIFEVAPDVKGYIVQGLRGDPTGQKLSANHSFQPGDEVALAQDPEGHWTKPYRGTVVRVYPDPLAESPRPEMFAVVRWDYDANPGMKTALPFESLVPFENHQMKMPLTGAAQRKWSAAGQVMYHAGWEEDAPSIQERGLQPAAPGAWNYQLDEENPEGVYLFENIEDAQHYGKDREGPTAIWEVDTDGLNLQPDAIFEDEVEKPHAWYSTDPISPERLRRVAANDYLDWGGWEGAHRFVTDGKEILTDPETEPIDESQWRSPELEDKFRTIYPESKSLVVGWLIPTADGMGTGIYAPAAGHGDKDEPGIHEIIGVIEKETGNPAHLITNSELLSDEKAYQPIKSQEPEWQTISNKQTKRS